MTGYLDLVPPFYFLNWDRCFLDDYFQIRSPIRAAEIVECVRKYMDGSSQNLQSLNSY